MAYPYKTRIFAFICLHFLYFQPAYYPHLSKKYTRIIPAFWQNLTRGRLWQHCIGIRLLHPQHLDGICTGQHPYRLPYDTLSEYPEPWSWKISGKGKERTYHFNDLKKTESQTRSEKNFLDSFFSPPFPPLYLGLCFFRSLQVISSLFIPSWNFSGPKFWILTKGVIRQPLQVLPCPDSI